MTTEVVPYKVHHRYGGIHMDDERWAKSTAWMKEHRPQMYERSRKQEAINAINELLPEWQAEQDRAQAWVDQHPMDGWEDRDFYMNTGYALLGLNTTATLTKRDVKNAYRRQARKLHPDVGGDEDAFKALHTAYRTILANTKA